MTIDHLLNSRVAVERLQLIANNGRAQMTWVPQAPPLSYVRVRLDMNFLRPGKDVPMAVEAGKAPDRIGVCFTNTDSGLKAGDRLKAVPNDVGLIPVPGMFEIRVIPDVAQDYSSGHHIEIQVVEVSQAVAEGVRPFPGGDDS
jgi:hypothetical protein